MPTYPLVPDNFSGGSHLATNTSPGLGLSSLVNQVHDATAIQFFVTPPVTSSQIFFPPKGGGNIVSALICWQATLTSPENFRVILNHLRAGVTTEIINALVTAFNHIGFMRDITDELLPIDFIAGDMFEIKLNYVSGGSPTITELGVRALFG